MNNSFSFVSAVFGGFPPPPFKTITHLQLPVMYPVIPDIIFSIETLMLWLAVCIMHRPTKGQYMFQDFFRNLECMTTIYTILGILVTCSFFLTTDHLSKGILNMRFVSITSNKG